MKNSTIGQLCLLAIAFLLIRCEGNMGKNQTESGMEQLAATANGGFENQVAFGEHLVTIGACNDCHTPKKMTAHGPAIDSSLLLSGHPASMPAPEIDRNWLETNGFALTTTETVWVGPWGVSYAANLTSDPTGIGNWTEENFIRALKEGKYKGLPQGRMLLPPMPWLNYRHFTDNELKAIFAYLKSTPPIQNVVPEIQPPVLASQH